MKTEASVARITGNTLRKHMGLSALLFLTILLSVGVSLLQPLALERIVDTLTAENAVLLSMAGGYFGIVAVSGLLDAAKESLITAFGQRVTHRIRSAMAEKLKRLPASCFIEREPGVTVSRFVNDVNTVDNLFTSGIISMAADLCRLVSILVIIFAKSTGLGILMLLVTPLLFWMTRQFQKRMQKAQMDYRAAVGRTSQQIPETLKNMRTIRVLRQEHYMLERYGDTIEQSYQAQERSNFYDAVYSPIVVSVSSLLIDGFDLTVKEGESVILAGRTGAGKSTLIRLIAGLYRPERGEIRVSGRAPDSIPENEKRSWFGYVEQQFRLVPGTVGDQVSLSDPRVTDAQIRQALERTGLWETVAHLPDGIHTPCTEELFSHGQFQLLSIARAVVMEPEILLLDEITANLDSGTEEMVLSAIRAASQNRTVISVSHRLFDSGHDPHMRIVNIIIKFVALMTLW